MTGLTLGSPLIVLDADQVREQLPMSACIEAMAAAMQAASYGNVTSPPRQMLPLGQGGVFALMPATGEALGVYGAKIVGVRPGNAARGLPAIQGIVVLFDYETGVPLIVMNGAEVTAIRTAAASGLATRLLARKDAATLGLFGTGVQAVTHLDAMRTVRPLRSVRVWGIDHASTEQFAQKQAARTGIEVRAADSPDDAASCDIVCTVTNSPTPILAGNSVRPGTHVNLVGAHSLTTREADTALIRKSSVYVDLLASTRAEGGDIMIPYGEGAITLDCIVGEIGHLLAGEIPGRRDDSAITVYNSVGFAAQDLYAAASVLRRINHEP
jgi:ornithine cyclodeaminase